MKRALTLSALGTAALVVLSGCSTSTSGGSGKTLEVAAAFYPVQFVAETIAGDKATVVSLAKPGVEPHDLELSPSAVRALGDADVVLYLSGFQPAVDDAIASTGTPGLDVATVVTLHSADHDAEGHSDEEDDHDHGAIDPHFWLDPTLLAQYAEAVGTELSTLDPANANMYTANTKALVAELTGIDASFTTGLAQCQRDQIVTSHEAFGYLADRYGLEQIGIAGIDPEAEPSPARLLEIRDVVKATGTTTVFTESSLNSAVADSIANDAGVATAVLDPIESVTGDDDYASVMARNLEALRAALDCV